MLEDMYFEKEKEMNKNEGKVYKKIFKKKIK